jgi:hypothetical protein
MFVEIVLKKLKIMDLVILFVVYVRLKKKRENKRRLMTSKKLRKPFLAPVLALYSWLVKQVKK